LYIYIVEDTNGYAPIADTCEEEVRKGVGR